MPIAMVFMTEPFKLDIMNDLQQSGLFIWEDLLGTEVKYTWDRFGLRYGCPRTFFFQCIHADTMKIVELLMDFVKTHTNFRKFQCQALILEFMIALGNHKAGEQLCIIQRLLPLINIEKLNNDEPYNVRYLNQGGITRGLTTIKLVLFRSKDKVFIGFLDYYKNLPANQQESIDPLMPNSLPIIENAFLNYKKKVLESQKITVVKAGRK